MNNKVIISRDRTEMAERISIIITSRVIENPKLNIVLTVGATPAQTYRHLASLAIRGVADMRKCNFILNDEFFGPTDEQSIISPHYRELQTTFFSQVNIPERKIIRPKGELKVEQALSLYKELINVRKPNLVILGISPDGSLGWNKISNINQTSPYIVDISKNKMEENRGYNHCITLSIKQIMEADEVILMAVARNKAEIVKSIIEDKEGKSMAAYVLLHHPRVLLFLDSKSATLLGNLSLGKQAPNYVKGFHIINDQNLVVEKKVICFSPHPDDTAISAGASLSLLSPQNTVISCVATTGHRAYIPNSTRETRIQIREDEATTEAQHLGASAHFLRLPLYDRGSIYNEEDLKIVAEYLDKEKPDMIFLPHTGDSHPTHRAVLYTIIQAISKLISDCNFSCDIYMYEGPWSLFPSKSYNTIFSPPAECFAQKLAAIRAHTSQTARTPYDKAADALALLRGSLVPEQDLGGFGEDPPKLEERIELFFHMRVATNVDIQTLLSFFNDEKAPSISLRQSLQ